MLHAQQLSGISEISAVESGNHHITPTNKFWDQNNSFSLHVTILSMYWSCLILSINKFLRDFATDIKEKHIAYISEKLWGKWYSQGIYNQYDHNTWTVLTNHLL